MDFGTASCSTCKLRPKEDGGQGGCTRTETYPHLRELATHNCPLYRRQPTPRRSSAPPPQEGLF